MAALQLWTTSIRAGERHPTAKHLDPTWFREQLALALMHPQKVARERGSGASTRAGVGTGPSELSNRRFDVKPGCYLHRAERLLGSKRPYCVLCSYKLKQLKNKPDGDKRNRGALWAAVVAARL